MKKLLLFFFVMPIKIFAFSEDGDYHLHLGGSVSREFLQSLAVNDVRDDLIAQINDPSLSIKLFSISHQLLNSPERIKSATLDVINKSEASYLEIRTGLRSFDESKNYQPYLDSFVQALRESPKAVKGYLSVDRFKSEHDKNYINFIIDAALKNSDVIAGIDISGFSPHAPRMLEGEFLSQTIEKILQHNLCLTIHMGETQSQEEYRDSTTVLSSLQKLFEKNSLYRQKVRLGHVIFLTDEQVGILLELRVPCEFCPSSFIFLTKNIEFDHKKHPLKKIFKEGVSVLLGTDDTLIFQTSFKEEQNKFKQFFILGEPMH